MFRKVDNTLKITITALNRISECKNKLHNYLHL